MRGSESRALLLLDARDEVTRVVLCKTANAVCEGRLWLGHRGALSAKRFGGVGRKASLRGGGRLGGTWVRRRERRAPLQRGERNSERLRDRAFDWS